MQVTYQLTQKDLREALTAHRNPSVSIFLRPVSYLLLLAFFGGLCVLLAHFNSARFSTDLRLLEFGILWAVILWLFPGCPPDSSSPGHLRFQRPRLCRAIQMAFSGTGTAGRLRLNGRALFGCMKQKDSCFSTHRPRFSSWFRNGRLTLKNWQIFVRCSGPSSRRARGEIGRIYLQRCRWKSARS